MVWSFEQDMETLRILQEQYEKESREGGRKANIPVPPIEEVKDYDQHVARDYVRPVQYQKFVGTLRQAIDFVRRSGNPSMVERHIHKNTCV